MDKQLSCYTVVLEGIDKCGKNLIQKYIYELSNKKYIVHCRGILSQIVYTLRYKRDYSYRHYWRTDDLIVLLDVDKDDWLVRCKFTDEPVIDYDLDYKYFNLIFSSLTEQGATTMRFNTSQITPYNIAKSIIAKLEAMNEEL